MGIPWLIKVVAVVFFFFSVYIALLHKFPGEIAVLLFANLTKILKILAVFALSSHERQVIVIWYVSLSDLITFICTYLIGYHAFFSFLVFVDFPAEAARFRTRPEVLHYRIHPNYVCNIARCASCESIDQAVVC